MPDVTVSFTDAQWTRIVAASPGIKNGPAESGDVDAAYLANKWKTQISGEVRQYERSQASISDF
tara:strand:+ start:198 stop:389 length:192 start_codon:yes stop_codon:yes gene_type:complete